MTCVWALWLGLLNNSAAIICGSAEFAVGCHTAADCLEEIRKWPHSLLNTKGNHESVSICSPPELHKRTALLPEIGGFSYYFCREIKIEDVPGRSTCAGDLCDMSS